MPSAWCTTIRQLFLISPLPSPNRHLRLTGVPEHSVDIRLPRSSPCDDVTAGLQGRRGMYDAATTVLIKQRVANVENSWVVRLYFNGASRFLVVNMHAHCFVV